MARPNIKHRNRLMPNARVSEDEYNLIYAAWQESGLPFADFILMLLQYHKSRNMSASQKRHSNRKKGK